MVNPRALPRSLRALFSCHISSLSEMPPLVPMLIPSCYVPSPGISPEPSPTYITAYQTSLLGSHRPIHLHSSKHDPSPFSNPSQPSSLYYSGSAACQESRQEPGGHPCLLFHPHLPHNGASYCRLSFLGIFKCICLSLPH